MTREFVKYEQSLALEELGFGEECFAVYYGTKEFTLYSEAWVKFNSEFNGKGVVISAPLYQQAFRWFREKYGLCNFINFSGDGFCSGWEDLGNNEHGFENFKTYEEAESACLDKLIEIVKNK